MFYFAEPSSLVKKDVLPVVNMSGKVKNLEVLKNHSKLNDKKQEN